jgi:hypothetical protein
MATKVGFVDHSGKVTFTASATIDQYECVKATGGTATGAKTAAPAGSGESVIGVAMTAATATGIAIDVKMLTDVGTFPAVNAASVTAGAPIYAFTGGLVKATTTAGSGVECALGVCVSGSTTTLSQIEWVPTAGRRTT